MSGNAGDAPGLDVRVGLAIVVRAGTDVEVRSAMIEAVFAAFPCGAPIGPGEGPVGLNQGLWEASIVGPDGEDLSLQWPRRRNGRAGEDHPTPL